MCQWAIRQLLLLLAFGFSSSSPASSSSHRRRHHPRFVWHSRALSFAPVGCARVLGSSSSRAWPGAHLFDFVCRETHVRWTPVRAIRRYIAIASRNVANLHPNCFKLSAQILARAEFALPGLCRSYTSPLPFCVCLRVCLCVCECCVCAKTTSKPKQHKSSAAKNKEEKQNNR